MCDTWVKNSVVMAEFARFCANSAIATFALVAKLCKFHICNIFAQGKFGANSSFHPVEVAHFSENCFLPIVDATGVPLMFTESLPNT